MEKNMNPDFDANLKFTLYIEFKEEANGDIRKFVAKSNSNYFSLLNDGLQNIPKEEYPFVADEIWRLIESDTKKKVLRHSIKCKVFTDSGGEYEIPLNIINSSHSR